MPTNISGTITAGGTAQSLVSWPTPAPHVTGVFVQNLDTSTDLYIREDGTVASVGSGSIKIPPGGLYETPTWWPGKINPSSFSIFSTKTGHAFTARWY